MLPLPVPVPVIVRPQRTLQPPPSRIPKTITQPPVDSPQTESDYPKPPILSPANVRPHFARKRCTSQGMHLTRTRYMQATSALRCLAKEMLDFRLPAEDQDPDTWRLFLHRLSEADPVFLNYEANWPVYFYFNEWRQDTRRHRKRDALASQTCRDGVYSTKRARNATQKSASQATPIIHYHSGTDGIEQCPAMTSTSLDQTARPDANCSSTSTQSSSSSSAYVHRYTDSTEFHLLLQALVPRIDDLAPAFERNGVRDLNSLRALASFPPSPFSIFLREDMGLNPFQVRQVTLALRSLQGHK